MSESLKKALASLREEYAAECAKRDAVNKMNEPLEEKLASKSAEIARLRDEETALSRKIDENRGNDWIELKKRIGQLADSIMGVRRSLGEVQ